MWQHREEEGVGTAYLIAGDDKIIPVAFQQKFAEGAGCEFVGTVEGVGHMLVVSRSEECAGFVREVVGSLV